MPCILVKAFIWASVRESTNYMFRFLFLLMLLAACISPSFAEDGYYKFDVIKGERRTARGAIRKYHLYVPKQEPGMAPPPYPVVVLLHGFMRTAKHMSRNAQYLAKRGIVVLVPQMDMILFGYDKRGRNMDDVIDHISWLVPRAGDKGDSLYGVFDPERLGILGHSSGGPIAIEVCIGLQKKGIKVDSMSQVDAIVWDRTWQAYKELKPLNIISVRSEPAVCNGYAQILGLLDRLGYPYRDIKVNGSKHCDPENPTNPGCMCICGPSHDRYRHVFVRLMYEYFKDRLHAPAVADSVPTLEETVKTFESRGQVTLGKGWDEVVCKDKSMPSKANAESSKTSSSN